MKNHLNSILKALSVLNAVSCLRFEPASFGDKSKIEFIYGKDCSSSVGKQGGTQKVTEKYGCPCKPASGCLITKRWRLRNCKLVCLILRLIKILCADGS